MIIIRFNRIIKIIKVIKAIKIFKSIGMMKRMMNLYREDEEADGNETSPLEDGLQSGRGNPSNEGEGEIHSRRGKSIK